MEIINKHFCSNMYNLSMLTGLNFSPTYFTRAAKVNFNQLSLHQLKCISIKRLNFKHDPKCCIAFNNKTIEKLLSFTILWGKVYTHKSARVVIPSCFCIPKSLQNTIYLKKFIFYGTITTTTTKSS